MRRKKTAEKFGNLKTFPYFCTPKNETPPRPQARGRDLHRLPARRQPNEKPHLTTMAKNLLRKYVWLVETIYRAGRITLDEINRRWIDDGMDEREIPLRTFHKWRIAAEDMFGLIIECDRRDGYRYYIDNPDEVKGGSLRSWLLDTISVSNLLLDSQQQLKERILLEEIPSGTEFLSPILEAMKAGAVLRIAYRSFAREESSAFCVHPYCIKLFRRRWYLVARSPQYDRMMIYALDRIQHLEATAERFRMPADFVPADFFSNYFGVTVGPHTEVETVRLRVAARQAPYLRSLRLHPSQTETERGDEYSIFTLRLCPEIDFEMELLARGEDIEVLAPEWLRRNVAERIARLHARYAAAPPQAD